MRLGDRPDWRGDGKRGVTFVSQTFGFRSIHAFIHISQGTEIPSLHPVRRRKWRMGEEFCVGLVHLKISGENPRGKVQRSAVNENWDADTNWKISKCLGGATQREEG